MTEEGLIFFCDEAACKADPMFYEIFTMDDRCDIIRAILKAVEGAQPRVPLQPTIRLGCIKEAFFDEPCLAECKDSRDCAANPVTMRRVAQLLREDTASRAQLDAVEPELKGTIIGKVRLLLRSIGFGGKSAASFMDALTGAGLKVDHAAPNPGVSFPSQISKAVGNAGD